MVSFVFRNAMKAIAKTHFFTAYSASAKKFFERLWNAAWPQPLRKASGFPELVEILAAMPLLRQSLILWSRHCGKPEAFRKGSGKAAL